MDAERLPAGVSAESFAQAIIRGGATLLQYRNKTQPGRAVLAEAEAIKRGAALHSNITLIMNDRADLCVAVGFGGVHLGQDDLSPRGARRLCPAPLLVGISTHHPAQVAAADREPVDYIAIGPVFATASKAKADPVVGLDGVREARKLTSKSLVAIGGITRANCRAVMDAGADSVAVIAELLHDPHKTTEEFMRILG